MAGIILSPYNIGYGIFGTNGDLPFLETIPKALLYWDEISIPMVLGGTMRLLDEAVTSLESLGVLKPWTLRHGLSPTADVFDFARDILSKLAERGMDGQEWTYIDPSGMTDYDFLARFSPEASRITAAQAVIEIGIRGALPIPPKQTPYEDIVEFRRKRSDELLALDSELEFLSASLAGMQDHRDAVECGQRRIAAALAELDRVSKERWKNRLLGSIRSKTTAMLAGGAAGAAMSDSYTLPILAGAAAGGIATPVLEAIIESLKGPTLPDRLRPYFYAFQGQRLFKSPPWDVKP